MKKKTHLSASKAKKVGFLNHELLRTTGASAMQAKSPILTVG